MTKERAAELFADRVVGPLPRSPLGEHAWNEARKSYLEACKLWWSDSIREERDAAVARAGKAEAEAEYWKCTPCLTCISERDTAQEERDQWRRWAEDLWECLNDATSDLRLSQVWFEELQQEQHVTQTEGAVTHYRRMLANFEKFKERQG